MPPTATLSRKGKTKAQIAREVREREQEAVRLRALNLSYAAIADELGYGSESSVKLAIQRTLDRHEEADVERLRQVENAKIDWAEAQLVGIINGFHAKVDHGSIIYTIECQLGADGEVVDTVIPLEDVAPRIAALREYRQYLARRAALRGLDAPLRKILEVVTPDMIDAEIARVEGLAVRLEAEQRQQQLAEA